MTKAPVAAGPSPHASDPRRRKLLDAALTVFLRFGFRKTSMDEVARGASVSRQGLYLHFSTKDDLFRATVHYALESSLSAAEARLNATSAPVASRLVGAFDEWVGRYVGWVGPGVSDLAEVSDELVGPLLREYDKRFVELVAKYVRTCGLGAAYKPAGLRARQLASTLYATARGLKHFSATREEFVDSMSVAVRALCLPLAEPK